MPSLIPNIIHLIFFEIKKTRTLRDAAKVHDALKKKYVNFNVNLWTESNAADFVKLAYAQYFPAYNSYSKILKIDMFKILLMDYYGGYYHDLDIVLGKEFFSKIPNCDILFFKDKIVNNCFFASKPRHPFWLKFLEKNLSTNTENPYEKFGCFALGNENLPNFVDNSLITHKPTLSWKLFEKNILTQFDPGSFNLATMPLHDYFLAAFRKNDRTTCIQVIQDGAIHKETHLPYLKGGWFPGDARLFLNDINHGIVNYSNFTPGKDGKTIFSDELMLFSIYKNGDVYDLRPFHKDFPSFKPKKRNKNVILHKNGDDFLAYDFYENAVYTKYETIPLNLDYHTYRGSTNLFKIQDRTFTILHNNIHENNISKYSNYFAEIADNTNIIKVKKNLELSHDYIFKSGTKNLLAFFAVSAYVKDHVLNISGGLNDQFCCHFHTPCEDFIHWFDAHE